MKAVFNCPEDMRPGNRTAPALFQPRPSTSAGPTSGETGRAPAAQGTVPKRTRDDGNSGLTPEAKKAKKFSDAVKANLTLFVREKDGAPLTSDRYLALKTSFTYFVEDMLTKNKDPPICSGRWQESRSVVKIPMASEEDLLWMRCFLDKSYLVQTEKEYNASKGKVYVAFLRDRTEPELTHMRTEKLTSFVNYYKRQAEIGGLFEIKMAAKTNKGKAIHLVMDDKAEAKFVELGCKIPIAAAGWVSFEERSTYVARIKAQDRERMRPKARTRS